MNRHEYRRQFTDTWGRDGGGEGGGVNGSKSNFALCEKV